MIPIIVWNSGRGRLAETPHPGGPYKALLPQIENKDCRDLNATIRCFNAGGFCIVFIEKKEDCVLVTFETPPSGRYSCLTGNDRAPLANLGLHPV